jgi:hypothetical protein
MRRPLAALALLVCCALACSKKTSHADFVPPHYADGAEGLKALWRDVLEAAKNDDRERVHDLLATTLLSDEEVKRLLGPKADPLLPRYHQLMGNLINRGAVEFVAQVYEHKYDTVDAFTDDNSSPVTAAMLEPHPFFAARVHKSTEAHGLRYDGFFYLDGRWKTFNQLGKFIEVVGPAAPTPSPAAAPKQPATK